MRVAKLLLGLDSSPSETLSLANGEAIPSHSWGDQASRAVPKGCVSLGMVCFSATQVAVLLDTGDAFEATPDAPGPAQEMHLKPCQMPSGPAKCKEPASAAQGGCSCH